MEFRDYATKEANEFVDRLVKAASAAAQTSAQRAAEEGVKAVEAVKKDLHAKTHEADELAGALKNLQSQGENLRKEAKSQRERADAAEAHVGRIREALGTAEAARMQSESARAQENRARTAMEVELKEVRKALDATMAESERLSTQLESAVAEKAALEEKFNSAQFSRVALFRLKGNKLEGTYEVGDLNTDIAKVVIPLSMDGLLARAVSSGCIESIEAHGSSDAGRAPFGGSPTCALALPVVVQSETFGIVYADNGAEPDQKETAASQTWKGRFAELVLRHAVALLMRLTSELRTLAELREHASRLLNHVADMYSSDVDSGVQGNDLRARLNENVECARRLYAQRVEVETPAAAALLDDELARLIDTRAGTPFGRDLAALAGAAPAAAEAS